MKKCYFNDEENPEGMYKLVKEFSEENLVNSSKKMAGLLYSIMNSNITIPSADFAAVTFQFKSVLYLALLKMNYKESFVHMTNSSEGSNVNSIIKYKAALPASSAKLSEAVIINLADYTVNIVEKKYEVNGEKCNYLSELYLKYCFSNFLVVFSLCGFTSVFCIWYFSILASNSSFISGTVP